MTFVNHYKIGVNYFKHRDKVISSSLNTDLPNFIKSLDSKEIEIGYVPAGYEHRPDLISFLFYDTVTYDWMIMMYNNIKDPFQELNVGDRILLPKL